MVTCLCGITNSMIFMQCCFRWYHEVLISSVIRISQGVDKIRLLAKSKSARLYIQCTQVSCLHLVVHDTFSVRVNFSVRWSDVEMGGSISTDIHILGFGSRTRSIKELFPFGDRWVGSSTTCVRLNLYNNWRNLALRGLTADGLKLMLKSPTSTILLRSIGFNSSSTLSSLSMESDGEFGGL